MRLDLFLKQASVLACVALVLSSCKKQEETTSRAVESGKASTKQEAKAEPKALVELADFTKEQALPEASPTKVAEPASENVDLPLSEEAQAMLAIAQEAQKQLLEIDPLNSSDRLLNLPKALKDPNCLIAAGRLPDDYPSRGIPAVVIASVGDQSVQLRANETGSFPRIYVRENALVKLVLHYPNCGNMPIVVSPMDGGDILNNRSLRLDENGNVELLFQVGEYSGSYRVLVDVGEDEKTLRFWAQSDLWKQFLVQ
jgi:hypothetical protein